MFKILKLPNTKTFSKFRIFVRKPQNFSSNFDHFALSAIHYFSTLAKFDNGSVRTTSSETGSTFRRLGRPNGSPFSLPLRRPVRLLCFRCFISSSAIFNVVSKFTFSSASVMHGESLSDSLSESKSRARDILKRKFRYIFASRKTMKTSNKLFFRN